MPLVTNRVYLESSFKYNASVDNIIQNSIHNLSKLIHIYKFKATTASLKS